MAESAVKKPAEALQEMATWAATGRDHYGMIFEPDELNRESWFEAPEVL